MKQVITINRQFGSGGREIGKRLADALHFAYYDKELIRRIAEETGLCESYIERYDEQAFIGFYPYTFGHTLATTYPIPENTVFVEESKVIRQVAEAQDCVIIGRCAGYLLGDRAFRVLIYSSDMDKRIERCYEKVPEDRNQSVKEMKKRILDIDNRRGRYYEYYTGAKWLDLTNYNLCIDTAVVSIPQAVDMIASLFRPKD